MAIAPVLDAKEKEGLLAADDQEMDMKGEKWPTSLGQESSCDPIPKEQNHTQDY